MCVILLKVDYSWFSTVAPGTFNSPMIDFYETNFPVKCTLVASTVDNFAEITFLVTNNASSANKWKHRLPRSYRDFILDDFREIFASHWIRVFSSGS